MKDLAQRAVDTAKHAGADYADARVLRVRNQQIQVLDLSPKSIGDRTDAGIGIRVLKDGAWGFASISRVDKRSAEKVAREAVAVAKASSLTAKNNKVKLAQEPPHIDRFETEVEIDPFSVPIDDKLGLLLRINESILRGKDIVKAIAVCRSKHRHQFFISTEGSEIETLITTVDATYTAVAVKGNDSQTRTFMDFPKNAGWEHINSLRLAENAERIADQARAKLSAEFPAEGKKDLILDPFHMSLTIHESVGHATELDRVLGYEANFAGTSFVTLDKKKDKFRYGSDIVNLVADNTLKGGLSSTGYDDEGVQCQKWDIVRKGIFQNYSSTREVAPLAGYKRSFGSGRADSYASLPINRIPNLSLMPGRRSASPDDLIADIKDGIWIEGRGSWSIDQRRLNFQFGGDLFYRIKNGKKTGMLRDVIYQSITPQFWGSVDGLTSKKYWIPCGIMNCGKGEPMQIAQMTHGSPWVRVRKVQVNRGKK
ncbi:TldD/PmbA family protein [candidate division WOR-3 bacterium]|uniref:TldD/PmbA family protein n=1 Tax=candidate division WOR-3 bacterium TaxID=2052148 RepID=A0A9D5QCQ5_UNCW3|nr:TldD/PmbA family protein [candidate division WOR-3 bacterium]MBD3364814.1 TldD/PmbA family protein [candidate division WOR-3 bacterium]